MTLFYLDHRSFKRVLGVIAFITTSSLFITGCATVGPDYIPPKQKPPIQWSGSNSEKISNNPLAPSALNQWWETLEDPHLTQLINRAIEGNLSLRDAKARVRKARAQRGISDADRFPTLNASAAATRSRLSENSFYSGTDYSGSTNTLYEGGFDASWEIDVFGRVQRQIEVSQANLDASEENYRDVLITLMSEVALNYVEVRTLQARLSVAESNLASQAKIVELIRSSVEIGETAPLDLEQARANLETTRANIPSLEINLIKAKNRLSVLLGKPPGSLNKELAARKAIPAAPSKIAVGVPAEVLRRRPDLRRAEREFAAATASIGVATSALYPKLSLFGSLGLESLDSGNFLSSSSKVFGILPSLQWNIFDGGRIRSNIEIANAVQEQALIAYEATLLTALQDVEDSITAYGKEMVRRQALIDGERAAKRVLEIADDQYKAGETGFFIVLDAQRSLLSLQDQLAASNGLVTTNVISLFKALGGGWEPLEPKNTHGE